MSRAAGTSMASPGSRKARCMSTTSSAVLSGASLSAVSKAEVRSTFNSALGSASAHLERLTRLFATLRAVRPILTVSDPSTQLSARLRLRLERLTQLSARLRLRLERLTQLSARLRLTSNYHAPTEKALGM